MRISQPFKIDPAATAAFDRLRGAIAECGRTDEFDHLNAVVIGGGTGAPVSIKTLLTLGLNTSAVVAMADDGGSTGILREEANCTPPGDIRKCIAAFAKNQNDPLTRAFRYRFSVANNHTLGNLMLAALEDACKSFPDAIEICERLLDAQGHVYPSTLDHVTLAARTRDGQLLDGQAVASHSQTALEQIWLESAQGAEIHAYEPALQAIEQADLIVLGPGSLFTSIIPNLLVPGVCEVIAKSRASVCFVCSLADVQGETWGLTAREHVQALMDHGMAGLVDYVLLHTPEAQRAPRMATGSFAALAGHSAADHDENIEGVTSDTFGTTRPVCVTYEDILAIRAMGPVVIERNLVDEQNPTWHNPEALREAFAQVIKLASSRKSGPARAR